MSYMSYIDNQTFENNFIINLIAHFISKKYNIDYSYSFFEDFKKLGINLFLGQHYYVDSLEINSRNFFDYLFVNENNELINLNNSKLDQNIKINQDNLFDYQTPEFTQILNDYFQTQEIKENIINANIFKERYNNNEDLFIFIESGKNQNNKINNEKMTLKNIAYYDSILSKLKFNNGYFMVDKDSIDLKIYIKLIEKYNLKILNKSTIENIMFASSCKYLILSESFANSISLQQVQRHHIRDTRYRKTACDIADPLDLLNTGEMEISKPSWDPLNNHNNNLSYILGLISYHSTLFNKPDFRNHIPSKKHNYIINLDRRKDRWESITNLIKSSPSLSQEEFIRFSAFDAYDFQNEINRFGIHDHPIINDMKLIKKILKIGELGCYLSHTLLLKHIIENDDILDDDLVSIYEDDFCLCDNFESNYKNFINIDLQKYDIDFLYTGGRFWSQYIPQQIDNDYFEKISDFDSIYYRKKLLQNPIEWDRTTTSYIIKKSVSKKVYNLLIKRFIENCKAIDHSFVSLYKDIKMYDYIPHLFWCQWNSEDSDIQNSKLLDFDNQIDFLPKIKELDEKKEEKKEEKKDKIKIAFIAFWHDFNYMDNVYTKKFLQKYKNIEISAKPDEANILIVGSFVNQQNKTYIETLKAQKPELKTVLCITEPIGNFYQEAFQMLLSFPFDKVFGCINNDGLNRNKYPLYLNYFDYEDANIYSLTNNYFKNIDIKTLITKEFCCLINSHDQGNTRGNIHRLLNLTKVVTCPGKLFNNCSNEELNKIGNINYIKNFVFNICAENFKTQFPGYITEKLLHACLGGAIPIYSGSFDEIDEKIFNKNRIIFYDSYEINSIVNTYNLVKDLYNNPEKLFEFYRQPIFQDSAYETVMNMKKNVENMFDGIIRSFVAPDSSGSASDQALLGPAEIIMNNISNKTTENYSLDVNNILWSKGPLRNDYSKKGTEEISSEIEIIEYMSVIKNNNNILWIRNGSYNKNFNTDLDIFSNNIDKLNNPIILITSDGDRDVPSSYKNTTVKNILKSDKIITWYTQNYDETIIHPKIKPIPIGLPLHATSYMINNSIEDTLKYMMKVRNNNNHLQNKIKNIIFSDAHLSISHNERSDMYNILKDNKNIKFLSKRISFEEITEIYNKYQFVISPRGNGYDCHRTWELFLAGCIIITKTSPLDNLFIENNLPVIIIKDWNELNENIEQKLEDWYNKYIEFTSIENIYPKFSFKYWIKYNGVFRKLHQPAASPAVSHFKQALLGASEIDNIETYNTKYGKISLYKNEIYIGSDFKNNKYWEEDTLIKLKQYINPNKNILEIGGHCGTSTIVYASYINNNQKLHVYEPQKNMFKLLLKNINQNNLSNKIIPYNMGVFCYNGDGKMNNIDLDGGGGLVEKRYNEESNLGCNFGGIGLGDGGELIKLITIDSMNIDNIGFIHCDAQGSENFIFSEAINIITKNRPVIYFEDNEVNGRYLYDNVCRTYPNYKENSLFNIKKYCMEILKYSSCINNFNGTTDALLIP